MAKFIRQKELILLIVGLAAGVVGAYGPMLGPGFVPIAQNLGVSIDALAQSISWTVLCIGLGLFITNPLAKVIGRRPVYMGAIAIMFATSVWGVAVREFPSFLGSRIVAGIGMAPFEVLVQCTIGDLYFVHERATRIAIWNMFLLTGISGGGLVAGYIIERDGYQWTFGVCAIFFGILMFAVFFFVPETAYRRAPVQPVTQDALSGSDKEEKAEVVEKVDEGGFRDATGTAEKKHSYWRSLRIYTGRYSHAPGWKPFLRPVVMLFYPAVFWGFLVYGKHRHHLPPPTSTTATLTVPRDRHHVDRRLLGRQRPPLRRTALQLHR